MASPHDGQDADRIGMRETLKAAYDATPDGEVESICDAMAAEEDWLEALESVDFQ